MNVVELPETDKFKANLEKLKRHQESIAEFHIMMAKVQKAAYDAKIDAGFTPEQALELCKKVV